MSLQSALVLPPDVAIVPAAQLPATTRRRLGGDPDSFTLTRPGLRSPPLLVEPAAAELLAAFRQPRTLVAAVLEVSSAHGRDPEILLEAAFPLVERLLREGFLVVADHPAAAAIGPSLAPGDRFGPYLLIRSLRTAADVEVYQARRPDGSYAALKIARASAALSGLSTHNLAGEARILRALGGAVGPALLARGQREGRPYLATSWEPGIDFATAAAELRARRDAAGLRDLGRATVAIYATLEGCGFLHGDIHPDNLLVGRNGEVRLVDFGSAVAIGSRQRGARRRAGVGFYFEPELAAAALAERPLPPPSPAGEQYALGALLCHAFSGQHYLDFTLERQAMLRQIAEEPAAVRLPPWLSAVSDLRPWLRRMLAKDPAARFPSLDAAGAALDGLRLRPARPRGRLRRPTALARVLAQVERELSAQGPAFKPEPPLASVHNGMAGVAYGLYRLALLKEDAPLLAAADVWSERARRASGEPDAFLAPREGLTAALVGEASPAHGAAGPALVAAYLAHARDEPTVVERATLAFLAHGSMPRSAWDLTLGLAGVLWGAATLRERGAPHQVTGSALDNRGHGALHELWTELDRQPAVGTGAAHANLGMAHGWAGYLYATLRWCRASRTDLPIGFAARLSELGACAVPVGRGARWRWADGPSDQRGDMPSMPGWCNGSAGFVQLFVLAAELGWGEDCDDLAEAAAWDTWENVGDGWDLCCGLAGRAYSLLAWARRAGGGRWLERAQVLAEQAATESERNGGLSHRLYRGALGIALLAADLAQPERAAMPFFGDPGWWDSAPDRDRRELQQTSRAAEVTRGPAGA